MADYFLIAEILKYFELESDKLFYYSAFVYQVKMTTLDLSACYFFDSLFGAEDTTNKEVLNIRGVYIDIDTYCPNQTTLADCLSDDTTCYFDIANQTLYIHYPYDVNPGIVTVEYGKIYGFTNDEIRTFNSIDYLPELNQIPALQKEIDPLQYESMSFYGGDVIFNNTPVDPSLDGAGRFDDDTQFTGNDVALLYGQDGDTYTDLILICTNFIEKTVSNFLEAIVSTRDKREKESILFPIDTFLAADFPDIADDLKGKIKPVAYGRRWYTPGICVNSKSALSKEFFFSENIFGIFDVEAEIDKVWTIVVPTATNLVTGIVTLAVADAHIDGDNAKGLNRVRCAAEFSATDIPSFIIRDLNSRALGIDYNASNYNTVEWTSEDAIHENASIYMDTQKDLHEWISILQNSTLVGFQYMFENGRRTIRNDNPNRPYAFIIEAVEILNNYNLEKDNNEDNFFTDAIIQSEKIDSEDEFYYTYQNLDYYEESFREHRRNKTLKLEIDQSNSAVSRYKTAILLDDQHKSRPIIEIVLGDKKYFELRIYDMLYVELSYPGEITGYDNLDHFLFTDSTTLDNFLFTDSTALDNYLFLDYSSQEIRINQREFMGWQRMQVIGLYPDFENGTIRVKLRQRDYSDVFDLYTGYSP